jgi:hypothetical protein
MMGPGRSTVTVGTYPGTEEEQAGGEDKPGGWIMPVTNVDRLEALLAAVCRSDLEVLSPAERRRLADGCRRVAHLAEPEAGHILRNLPGSSAVFERLKRERSL